jgi:hypothetical protein
MQKISKLKLKSSRFKFNSSDILPLAFLGLSITSVGLVIVLINLTFSFSKLANKPPATLVQQVDGRAYTARPEGHLYREPELIRKTVSNWAIVSFSWGTLPSKQADKQKPTVDPGIEVKGQNRVPESVWEASFLLTPDFRDAFLEKLAREVIPQGVFDGKVSAVLVPQTISQPQVAGVGRWKVDMVATRILFDSTNPSGYGIPFNRTYYVKAIDPPSTPLGEDATRNQQVIYRMLESGLQIEEIRPLEQGG